MKKLYIFVALSALLLLFAAPVSANGVPALPHAFYGRVIIGGYSADIGTRVEARGEGVTTGIEDNPTVTTVVGIYGTDNPFEHRLIVQGDIEEGTTISFYVNGYSTGQTAEWHSGDVTELHLRLSTAGGGGGFAPVPNNIETNLFGEEAEFNISVDGEILETIEATSEAGDLTITIEEDTIALDEEDEPLESLEITVDESPPDPPEDAHVIGLAYDFDPDGATFDPPITMTYTLDLDDLPDGVAPEDLVIAYWDGDEWVELDSEVDIENSTITVIADVEHFTTFAVIAMPPPPPPVLAPAAFTGSSLTISPHEVDIGKTVTISILVANTGEEEGSYTVTLKVNGVVEETREITLAGGASETATFTTAEDEAGTYSVDVDGLTGSFMVREVAPPPPPALPAPPPAPPLGINWTIWKPVIIGVAVFLAIFLPIRLRRRLLG